MKNNLTTKNDLIPLAIAQLKETTTICGTLKPGSRNEDTRIVLCRPNQNDQVEFIVEAMRTLGAATATQIVPLKDQYVVVTNYVNPHQAEQLKKMGIQFIDCAGNAYINKGPLFVFVTGKKPENKYAVQQPRLLKPGGLQILFALLCNPHLINTTYRVIAATAGVALGTVAWAIKDLERQGFILDPGNKNRRLIKKEALLKIWLAGYEQLLRPKLIVNRYHAENEGWWQKADIKDGLWGGDIAAYKMTGYLKPQGVTIYAAKMPDRLMLKNRLRLDPQGEIEIMIPFWNFDYPGKKDALVPPLLVYADLMIQADGRTTETAGMIYEHYLARYFKEN